jgi:hypothetical protein
VTARRPYFSRDLYPTPPTAEERWLIRRLAREQVRLETEHRPEAREVIAMQVYRLHRGDTLLLEDAA